MRLHIDTHQIVKNLRWDVPASIVVFLVALPLCLGIALASDAPLFAGVVTGIVGGIVVGILSGSQISVTGPAAGLTVIVASGIKLLGGFEPFLCAVFLAGLMQIVLWVLRAGFLASLFPNAVIKGMLTAIGITIILKQIPHAFGGFAHFESDMEFWHLFGKHSTLEGLRHAVSHISVSAFLICFLSLVILWTWDLLRAKGSGLISQVPGPLVAVTFATLVNWLFDAHFPNMALRAEDDHLVQLPNIDSLSALFAELRRPDFSALANPATWTVALTLAAIGSIETLLCIESSDKLDPQRRVSNTNRELFAQGVGNTLVGLIGGLPMTSVIVRSSANVYAGARSRMSAILHGVILLVSVLALSSILNLIPIAALAAILLAVGYKLAHPKLFKAIWKEGIDQFIPFIVTVLAILFTDLLTGVLIGFAVGLAFVIRATYYSAILVVQEGRDVFFRFTKDVSFIHKIRLRSELLKVQPGTRVVIDASRAIFIDYDVLEMIEQFVETAPQRNIQTELKDVAPRSRIRTFRGRKSNGNVPKTIARQ